MKKLHLLKTMLLLCALIVGSSSVWADEVTFAYGDYKGKGTSNSGSSYTMEKTDVSIGDTKFYGNNGQAHFYANGVTTITPASGVTITSIALTATEEKYNGYQSSGTVTPSKGSMSHDGTSVTWTGSATSAFTISHNKQILCMNYPRDPASYSRTYSHSPRCIRPSPGSSPYPPRRGYCPFQPFYRCHPRRPHHNTH